MQGIQLRVHNMMPAFCKRGLKTVLNTKKMLAFSGRGPTADCMRNDRYLPGTYITLFSTTMISDCGGI